MTLDKVVFADLLDEMASYFGRTVTPFVKKAWYKALSGKLTTEQFIQAVEHAVTTREFMPTAEGLLEAVKGAVGVIALEEWEKCLAAACRGDREVVSSLSEAGKVALRAVGGIHGLGQSEEKDQQWLQKKFVDIWKSVPVDQRPALPASNDAVILPPAEIQALASKMSMNGNGKRHE